MRPFTLLVQKEIRDLFFSRASALFLALLCLVSGYSFYLAVVLYSNASVAAVNNPLYAAGFEPVQGVFVPTWGAVFVLFSLFLPFVIIPSVASEKERNTLVILLQVPFTVSEILVSKLVAGVAYVLLSMAVMAPALFMWHLFGGHMAWGELILLNSGYFLYGLFVVGAAVFSASLFSNAASASILSILLITASWVIDFGKDMNISPLVLAMSRWTTTRMLGFFETGILSSSAVVYFVAVFVSFACLSRSLLDVVFNPKWLVAGAMAVPCAMLLTSALPHGVDVTESHRNSFSPAITRALRKLPPVEIDIYLRRTDSRFRDYEKSFLKRLRLIKKDVKIRLMGGNALEKDYGLFVYRINDRKADTYSNSEEEIFPILFSLSGIKAPDMATGRHFRGYPLVVGKHQRNLISFVYYLLLPLAILSLVVARNVFLKRGSRP